MASTVRAKNAALNRRLPTLEEKGESTAATPRPSMVGSPHKTPSAPPSAPPTHIPLQRAKPPTASVRPPSATPSPLGALSQSLTSLSSGISRPPTASPSPLPNFASSGRSPRSKATPTPRKFSLFRWEEAAAVEPLNVAAQVFNVFPASSDGQRKRDGLIREFQRLRGFDAFAEEVVVAMGRVELHVALQALEKAYIAVRDHEEHERAIPEYVADENIAPISKSTTRSGPRSTAATPSLPPVLPLGSKAATSRVVSAAPSRPGSTVPLASSSGFASATASGTPSSPRAKAQHPILLRRAPGDAAEDGRGPAGFADQVEQAGIASRQAFAAAQDPASKVVATKISISSAFHLHSRNMEEAKRMAFGFLKALYELPEVRVALESRESLQSKGFLSSLTALTQVMLMQEPQMINQELPLVPYEGNRKLHPCWDLDLERYSHPPQTLPMPSQTLQEGSKLLSRVVSLCTIGTRVFGGTEEGLLHVWETGQGLRLLHSIHAHQDSVLALATGEPFETPEDLLVARMNGSRLSSSSFSLARSARPSSIFKSQGTGIRMQHVHSVAEVDADRERSGDAEGGKPSPQHGQQLNEEENGFAEEEEEGEEEEEEEGSESASEGEGSQVFGSSSSGEEAREESAGAGEVDVVCRLYTGSMDKKIGVWDIPRNAKQPPILVCYLAGHWGWVRTLATSEDLLFSGSGDFTIRCWSARDLVCLHTLKIREHWINAVAVVGQQLFVASADHSVSVLDIAGDGRPVLRQAFEDAHENWVRALAVDGQTLFTCSGDGTIKMWDLPEDDYQECALAPRETVSGHTGKVTSLHVSSGRLFSASSTGEVKIWSIRPGTSPLCVASLRDVWRPVGDGIAAITSAGGRIFFAQGSVQCW